MPSARFTPTENPLTLIELGSVTQSFAETMLKTTFSAARPASMLIIAAGCGGLVPCYDHPKDALRLASIDNEKKNKAIAVIHPPMRHPWNRHDPLLFANTSRRRIEGDYSMPVGFVRL
jgi:hypothetical protein